MRILSGGPNTFFVSVFNGCNRQLMRSKITFFSSFPCQRPLHFDYLVLWFTQSQFASQCLTFESRNPIQTGKKRKRKLLMIWKLITQCVESTTEIETSIKWKLFIVWLVSYPNLFKSKLTEMRIQLNALKHFVLTRFMSFSFDTWRWICHDQFDGKTNVSLEFTCLRESARQRNKTVISSWISNSIVSNCSKFPTSEIVKFEIESSSHQYHHC